jgi:peptidyl-tRNA hydrolase, PTH1 family
MDRYLVVGLGNPGPEYDKTRHNIGFMVVDALAKTHGSNFSKEARKQGKALLVETTIAEKRVLLAKPQTYMNLSGEAVTGLLMFYKIPFVNLLVVCDDLDLPLGTLRIRPTGGSGGQNGLKNITQHLAGPDYPRMRLGIGRPPGKMEAAAYVLQPFAAKEEILVIETIDRAVKAVDTWLRQGLELAMTRHNGTAEESARAAANLANLPKPIAEPPTPER